MYKVKINFLNLIDGKDFLKFIFKHRTMILVVTLISGCNYGFGWLSYLIAVLFVFGPGTKSANVVAHWGHELLDLSGFLYGLQRNNIRFDFYTNMGTLKLSIISIS